ncbi:MAG: hypothetical protein ACTSR2_01355 [Candidatus Hodarchaeales archaeon]
MTTEEINSVFQESMWLYGHYGKAKLDVIDAKRVENQAKLVRFCPVCGRFYPWRMRNGYKRECCGHELIILNRFVILDEIPYEDDFEERICRMDFVNRLPVDLRPIAYEWFINKIYLCRDYRRYLSLKYGISPVTVWRKLREIAYLYET